MTTESPFRNLTNVHANKQRWWIHGVLFLTALLTTIYIGGPLYGVSLMVILTAHELGHYTRARHYGVAATLPFFIPLPLPPFGTFGAIIAMRSPIPNRKALFDIGVAGPVCGLIIALPVLFAGLYLSDVVLVPKETPNIILGEPLLFQWMARWIHGPIPETHDIMIHPVGYAGWAALFVTAINLFPVGQLDGGHMVYALLGKQARHVSWIVLAVLLFLGIRYQPMWYFFAGVLFLFLRKHPPPQNDSTPVGLRRWVLGLLIFALLPLCLAPVPFDVSSLVPE